jgi:hypothetical protein
MMAVKQAAQVIHLDTKDWIELAVDTMAELLNFRKSLRM